MPNTTGPNTTGPDTTGPDTAHPAYPEPGSQAVAALLARSNRLGRDPKASGGGHYAFRVDHPEEVEAFYAAALSAGGTDNGAPGPRPDYGPSYYAAFAALCLEHDSFQVGIDMMNVGLKFVPDDPSLYLSRGLLYVELAQFESAEADFSRVEKLSGFQSLGSYALDLADVQRNDPEQALARVRAQLKTHPDDPLLNFFLAQSLMNHSPDVQSDAFKEAMSAVTAAGHKSDVQTQAMATGKADIVDVVTAISETEVAVQTMVAVRDRVIQAYEDIMKMPI